MNENEMLLKYMNENIDIFEESLKKAVLIETPTDGDKKDLVDCRNYFQSLFEGIGCKCTVVHTENEHYGGHLLIEYGDGDEQILFIGHYDTAYAKGTFGPSLWVKEGNKIKGPGTLDMKGGDVQVYMIIRALKELKLMPKNKKIVFFLSCDEEAGSYTSHKHYEELGKKSKAAFVMEGGMGDDIGGCTIGRFGRGNYKFFAKGVTAHSGNAPFDAESGLIELAKQAVKLESYTDYNKAVSVACTSLHSGNAGWPTVPGEAELSIDARFSTLNYAQEYDEKFQQLESFNKKVKIITKGGLEKPPYDKDAPYNKALFEKAIEIGKEFGLKLDGRIEMGGTDGNFTSSVGCPTLDGLGMTGDFVHQPDKEYINLDHVAVRGAFVAKVVLETLRS
ncbi:MAG: M20 family metallopeptidase [Clostridiales bacterium]|nr:M20 family metallopeptidase [Clostridiales bacterium]